MKKISILMPLIAAGMLTVAPAVAQKAESNKAKTVKTAVKGTPVPSVGTASQVKELPAEMSFWMTPAAKLTFPALPYSYNALSDVIDSLTVAIHYDRHHRAYYTNFIKAIEGTEMEVLSIYEIFNKMSEFPVSVRNNGGGFYNHVVYWQNLTPGGGVKPSGLLAEEITKAFGSYDAFITRFADAAKTRFGSGWAWLAVDFKTGELFITSTANQDNPLMNTEERRGFPILGIDVWEHAYYLKYQNKRADYIESFGKIINWKDVEARYQYFLQARKNFLN